VEPFPPFPFVFPPIAMSQQQSHQSNNSNVIEVHDDDSSEGDLSTWIGCGKRYSNVPAFVSNALLRLVSVSETSKPLLPSRTLKVSELLQMSLPAVSSASVFLSPSSCFTDVEPNVTTAFLLGRTIPSVAFVTKLRGAAGQAMLDGKKSIRDWKSRDTYLPFESLGVWSDLTEASTAQMSWKTALAWLKSQNSIPQILGDRVNAILDAAVWHGRLPGLGSHSDITEMADFFSRRWLTDSHVDTMIKFLKTQITASGSET